LPGTGPARRIDSGDGRKRKSPERWEDLPLQWQAEHWAMLAQVLAAQGAWDDGRAAAAGRFEQAIAAFKELKPWPALSTSVAS